MSKEPHPNNYVNFKNAEQQPIAGEFTERLKLRLPISLPGNYEGMKSLCATLTDTIKEACDYIDETERKQQPTAGDMSKKAIALLKKVDKHIIQHTCGYTVTQDLKTLKEYVQQALALLKQQPTAGEFTKKIRSFVKLYENETPRRAEITFLQEACDRLDRAESINKDLLTACEIGLKKALGIIRIANEVNIPLDTQGRRENDKDIKQIKAAIAKAKKEGQG